VDDSAVNDPLRVPTYRPGHDVSSWPYVKLARAREHLNQLGSRVDAWVSTHPFGTEQEVSEDRLRWSLRLSVSHPPPILEWSVHVGDCVHNLRSALDAAVWEFATLDGAAPSRPRDVQFPIVRNEASWNAEAQRRLQTTPSAVIERIRVVQPFMRPPGEQAADPLVLLQYLSNLDKHQSAIRMSIPVDQMKTGTEYFGINFGFDEASKRNVPPNTTFHEAPDLVDGALLAEWQTVDPIVETHGGFEVRLVFGVDTPRGVQALFETLDGLIGVVGQIVSVMHGGAVREVPNPTE
jgi:hypothetical protein